MAHEATLIFKNIKSLLYRQRIYKVIKVAEVSEHTRECYCGLFAKFQDLFSETYLA